MTNWNLGVIGFGNIAQALIGGLLKVQAVDSDKVHVCAAHYDKLCRNAEKFQVHPYQTAEEVIEKSDVVILAVKPYQMEKVVAPIKGLLKDKLVVSVASGWMFDRFETILEANTHHITISPNTPTAVAEGIIIVQDKHSLTDFEFELLIELLKKTALVEVLDAEHMSIAGTLSGATPAYAAMFIEALGDAGVKHGLTRASAYRLASQMLAGTGKLYLEHQDHPGAMKDAVCSPGGITIVGVEALEQNGFRYAVMSAIDACQNKKQQ
ncbi:MAG: pyrroline-5-carboxylate reductase [Erysipelotrichaceae bacterium]|nr:pyrroline-5-carboxylate reductase [Erysipelotrichaceae bacterium]